MALSVISCSKKIVPGMLVLAGLLAYSMALYAADQTDTAGRYAGETEPGRIDAFLEGYITRAIDDVLNWDRAGYQLDVSDKTAHIILLETLPVPPGETQKTATQRRAELETLLAGIDGLNGVNISVQADLPVVETPTVEQEIYSFLGVLPDTVPLPTGDFFLPLLADPKQAQFFVSLRQYNTPSEHFTAAAVGFGETMGLMRKRGRRPGDGLQLSLAGAIFAQFNLDAESSDLINADYIIGLPITWRRDALSARLRFYHQSSHLGDEFLLSAQPERINLSFESLEFIVSYQYKKWRGYYGFEYLVQREPEDLERAATHGGLEYRGTEPVFEYGRIIGGVDIKRWQEHDWAADFSVKIGIEFGVPRPGNRRLRFMLEAYDGFSPHGQFYDTEIRYYGVGMYLGF